MALLRTDASLASKAMKTLLGLASTRQQRMTRMKVAKLLYLTDLRSVEHVGVLGSGVVWQWREHGPFSDDLYSVENALRAAGDISVEPTLNAYGNPEYRLFAPPLIRNSSDQADRFLEHLDAVLAEYGDLSPTHLKNLTYETAPMQEAQADGQRNVILDLGDTPPVPDATATLRRFQRMLNSHVDEEPAPRGCSEEILIPLRAARARANRILLDD
ncbi:type II toxin-antitoxin system antitoxin SocA domain-containing protein [Candidatus Poriferisodalis sp.]|uniref:type II toxin-antitoxin system antitoxin SocA domain-containing protein n=1 Tax=Candidatus Poriferisodalis sp. TaxID=3101277 RepID=UPI003D0D4099